MTITRDKLNDHKAEMTINLIKMDLGVKIKICKYF